MKKSLAAFAREPLVQKQADEMFRKLHAAQSPILLSWVMNRNLSQKKPDVILKEWRPYYAERFILSEFPHKDAALNAKIVSLIDGMYQRALPPANRARIEKAFLTAQKHATARIGAMNIPTATKQSLLQRVSDIKLYWMSSFKGSKFQSYPLEAISWGLAYDPSSHEINVGVEVMKNGNEQNWIAIMAHEMAHAFDPCRWSAQFKEANPFAKVIECLRDPKSAGALRRDDSQLAAMVKDKKLNPELAESLRKNPTCNKSVYPPLGLQADQSLEAFADWFAAEVLAEEATVRAPLRTDLCEEQKLNPGSSYLVNSVRLDRIFLAQPKLRKSLGLSATPVAPYCAGP